jgi:hypothetical protein
MPRKKATGPRAFAARNNNNNNNNNKNNKTRVGGDVIAHNTRSASRNCARANAMEDTTEEAMEDATETTELSLSHKRVAMRQPPPTHLRLRPPCHPLPPIALSTSYLVPDATFALMLEFDVIGPLVEAAEHVVVNVLSALDRIGTMRSVQKGGRTLWEVDETPPGVLTYRATRVFTRPRAAIALALQRKWVLKSDTFFETACEDMQSINASTQNELCVSYAFAQRVGSCITARINGFDAGMESDALLSMGLTPAQKTLWRKLLDDDDGEFENMFQSVMTRNESAGGAMLGSGSRMRTALSVVAAAGLCLQAT